MEQFSRIALPKEPALGIAMNKEHVARIARELGLDIPKGVYINSADEVNEALRVVGLPAVAKPAEPWDAQRGLGPETKFVMTPAEARLAIEAALSAGTGVLFQQFIPGPQESISFLYKHGEIFAQFAYQTKRASSLVGGVDVLHRSIAMPSDSGTQAERLIREIGLEGYCRVEFRRDYSNKPYMVDIHPYMSDGTELAMHAGVDFPYLLYQWAMGEPIDTIQTYRVGVWRRDLGGDFKATMERISQRGKPGVMPPGRAIRDFCVSFFTPAHYDLLDWKDPRPSWTTARGWFNNAFSRKKA
ncbi:MAG: ATP-grasp domain-containing protein [Ktedonobacteraceae bacterium]|nr:ATP-grasp domain-containing protein [Ktedonobacteraceae bacterium]